MKKCIISFASHGRENYNQALLGLISSCHKIWDGDYFIYSLDGYIDKYLNVPIIMGQGKYPKTSMGQCYNNNEVPYQFKVAMFQMAIDNGYDQVIWMDSTTRMMKHPKNLLDQAKKQGVVTFHNLGHPLCHWISDAALTKLGVNPKDREYINTLPQIMACVIIFDFTNPKGKEIFQKWKQHSQDGVSFQNGYGSERPEFIAHRHDQAILSYIVHKEGIPMNPYGELCYPPHHVTKEYGSDIYFLNKGVI